MTNDMPDVVVLFKNTQMDELVLLGKSPVATIFPLHRYILKSIADELAEALTYYINMAASSSWDNEFYQDDGDHAKKAISRYQALTEKGE